MIGLIERSAEHDGDRLAIVGESRQLTYTELLHQARTVAAQLQARGATRVAIVVPDPIEAIIILAGCAHAGIEACVLPTAATDKAVIAIADQIGEALIVTSRRLEHPRTVDTADILAATDSPSGEAATDGVVLVLTTGTTSGRPRAARHLWSRVLIPHLGTRPTPEHRWLLVYGLNQFGGLQVLLHVFAAGAAVYVPNSFQPRHAGRLLAPWQITHVSATPTFWRFALAELSADAPPPLAQVTLGGEAVPAKLLDDLRGRFPDARISQIYGATEYGSNITVRDGLPGIPLALLSANERIQFEVRDGELWVRSTTAMLGYRDDAAGAGQERDLDRSEWRPTGDLVEIVGDRVQFRGRASEVINVGGIKVHPAPVEARINGVDGVFLVRVGSRPSAVVGSIVAAELVLTPGHDPDRVVAAVRAACADLPPAARPRSIKVVDELPTTGNKIARGSL
ncbi:MAG: acyl--CoA ligase [Nocardioidaceae bacterium]|nr:acyl--CoA ligase [Nocardioidaceae bacterium]